MTYFSPKMSKKAILKVLLTDIFMFHWIYFIILYFEYMLIELFVLYIFLLVFLSFNNLLKVIILYYIILCTYKYHTFIVKYCYIVIYVYF